MKDFLFLIFILFLVVASAGCTGLPVYPDAECPPGYGITTGWIIFSVSSE